MGGALLAVGLFGAVLAYAVVQANAPARAQPRGAGDGGAPPSDMPQRIERFFASNPSPEQIEALAAELERAGMGATAQQLRAMAAQRRASASSTASSTTASSTSSTPRSTGSSSTSTSSTAETMEQELARMGMTREALDRQLATLGAEEDDVAELRRQGYPRIADYVETRVREGRAREAAATRESTPPRSSSTSSSAREEPPPRSSSSSSSAREDAPRSGSSSTSSSSSSSSRPEGPPPAMPPPPIERPVEGGESAPRTLEEELARAEREHPGARAQYDRAMRDASAADLRNIARPVRTQGYPLIADSLERRATELDLAALRESERSTGTSSASSERREERPRRESGGGGSRESSGSASSSTSSSSSSASTTTRAEGVDLRQARRLAPRVAEDVRSRRYSYSRDRVREFQRAAGLAADGEYGGATRGALVYFGVSDAPSALFRPTATVRYTPPDGATETASSSTSDGRTALA